MKQALSVKGALTTALSILALSTGFVHIANADTSPPSLLDPTLQVSTVLNTGLNQPIGIVFINRTDFLVLEKTSG